MKAITTRAQVDGEGMVRVPVGRSEAGAVVEVTIRPVEVCGNGTARHVSLMSDQEYRAFVAGALGSSPDFPDADGALSADLTRRLGRTPT